MLKLGLSSRTYIVLYDDDCSICRRFKSAVKALDGYRRIAALPMQDRKALRFLASIGEERYWSSFHLVTPLGEIYSADDAVPCLLSLLPGGSRVMRFVENVPGGHSLIRWLYRKLSRKKMAVACGSPTR